MQHNFDIIIGGGGTIGLACAVALAQNGFSVLILDKNDASLKINPAFDGRNIALNNATIHFLDGLGIWQDLRFKSQPINNIIVSDGTVQNGVSAESYVHFDAQDISQQSFGFFTLNPDIHTALLNQIAQLPNITLCYNTTITDTTYSDNYVQVLDNNNKHYQAPLLIAADGKESFIRKHSDIDVSIKDYQQTAIVCAVSHDKPHNGIAQEVFLPAGPFAILPLVGNATSLVWVENNATAQALLNAPKNVFHYELTRRFGDYLGQLNIISEKFSYPLKQQMTQSITANRIILMGDAAHVIHPISGQGFNLGIRDILCLVNILKEHRYAGLDIGSQIALDTYSKQRKKDIALLGNITSSLNWLFSNETCILQSSRRFGLGIVQKIPALRNFFSKAASEGGL